MARNKKYSDNKTEYVDIKSILRPSVIILAVFAMALSFVAVKLVAEGIKLKNRAEDFSGTSILGNKDYIISSSSNPEVADMGALSKNLSTLRATNTEWTKIKEDPKQNGLFCIATEVSDRRIVYNLDPENLCGEGYKLSDFKYLWVDSVNSGFYAVINIPGTVVDLSDYYILVHDDTGNLASRLVINCYEAKVVKLKNTILTGTLLAPEANVEYDATSVYGQVYAMASTGNRAFYKDVMFSGYSLVLTEVIPVKFENSILRGVVFDWLKKTYPSTYSGYPDDYTLTTTDISYVTELNLNDVAIADFGSDLLHFKNLQRLSVQRTRLTSLDLSSLPSVEVVDISETSVNSLALAPNNRLKVLIADSSKLTKINTELLGGLNELSLEKIKLDVLPDFSKLVSLKKLNISGTGFGSFTKEDIETLAPNLEHLDISENSGVTAIDLSTFKALKTFKANRCALTSLDLTGLSSLEILYCNYNNIKTLDITPSPSMKLCEAFGSSLTNIKASGMESVRIRCRSGVKIEK